MRNNWIRGRRVLAFVTVGAALLGGQILAPSAAQALPTTVPPILSRTSKVVTADALPTVQVDGVVWTQVMIGNTVYAAGDFNTARPAGAAPGESTTPRKNLLAYDITSGNLDTTFAPGAPNGQIKAIAVSADRNTVFVGGDFTKVGLATRLHFAAFDARTGALLAANPALNSTVNAITVVGTTVYVGGSFTSVGAKTRSRLAALSGSTGRLTTWTPVASDTVRALVATPDKTKIIAGGVFTKINGKWAVGMGAISIATGQTGTWKVNTVVRDYGEKSAILSLAVDNDTVYGTGYAFGGGNFEGTFAANPTDGSVRWLQDCHGDSYGVAPIGGAIYVVGHAHYCANIGGFPDTSPRVRWQRALVVSKSAQGTVAPNGQPSSTGNYGNFGGQPAPALYNWFPSLQAGTYTGQSQAAWSIVGNATYISAGGEFPAVNGAPQQGLVRFAVATSVPQRLRGPQLVDDSTSPQPAPDPAGGVALTWQTNSDQDDLTLSYEVLRDGKVVSPVLKASATFWNRTTITWTDPDVSEGVTYSYSVRATDTAGNSVKSPATSYAVPVTPTADNRVAERRSSADQSTATAEPTPAAGSTPTADSTPTAAPTPTADATPAAGSTPAAESTPVARPSTGG